MLIALIVNGLGARGGRNHGHLVALRDGSNGLRGTAAERPDEDVNLVLGDQTLGELGRGGALALVIVVDHLHHHLLPADVDAAAGVRNLTPDFEPVLLLLALRGRG